VRHNRLITICNGKSLSVSTQLGRLRTRVIRRPSGNPWRRARVGRSARATRLAGAGASRPRIPSLHPRATGVFARLATALSLTREKTGPSEVAPAGTCHRGAEPLCSQDVGGLLRGSRVLSPTGGRTDGVAVVSRVNHVLLGGARSVCMCHAHTPGERRTGTPLTAEAAPGLTVVRRGC
jgi:hypothetical protein